MVCLIMVVIMLLFAVLSRVEAWATSWKRLS